MGSSGIESLIGIGEPKWMGLENYRDFLSADYFREVVGATLVYSLSTVFQLIIALVAASPPVSATPASPTGRASPTAGVTTASERWAPARPPTHSSLSRYSTWVTSLTWRAVAISRAPCASAVRSPAGAPTNVARSATDSPTAGQSATGVASYTANVLPVRRS